MGPNEFTLQDDRLGFLDDGGELIEFLNIDTFTDSTDVTASFKGVSFSGSDITLPQIDVRLELSETMHYLQRVQYTFFSLLGDVGGFNGAIIIFPSYLMSWYAARKFNASIYEDMPIKKPNAKKRGKDSQQDMDGTPSESDLLGKLAMG